MLRIYPFILDTIRSMRPVLEAIGRHEADLARQRRRAASSVSLNTAEGMYSRGRLKTARYHVALGSMREVLACVETAEALGYVGTVDEALTQRADRIIGTLVRLVRPSP